VRVRTLATTRAARARYLTWQSDDLTSLGPCLAAYAHFTALRLLSLSCSPSTLDRAVGGAQAGDGLALFAAAMPYACVDLTGGAC
jgi:hypothetical protein